MTRVECELGEMHLEVEDEDSETALEVFESIWKNRLEEREDHATIEYHSLAERIEVDGDE